MVTIQKPFLKWVGGKTQLLKAIIPNSSHQVNNSNNNFFSYSTKIMAATDDAFTFLLGRAKMREKSMRMALDMQGDGISLPKLTPELMRAYQDDFYGEIFDAAGNIKDEATNFARAEVTLTQPLTGFAKGLNDVLTSVSYTHLTLPTNREV